MSNESDLQETITLIAQSGKGILAADESMGTIGKRFDTISLENTEENRRAYRSLLCTAPNMEQYISGVIFFEETLGQKSDDGIMIPEVLSKKGIVPGVKVDKGFKPLAGSTNDFITFGLDGLADRLAGYKKQGARFAKWREVYQITQTSPSPQGLRANAEMLARYAATCQEAGIVPIVEPEVLMDGSHDIQRSFIETEKVLHSVFDALALHNVTLEHIILKPSMIIPGKECAKEDSSIIAKQTLQVLRRTVPSAVPTINFLSGGQGPEEATCNLNAMNQLPNPWLVSFSYGRALQEPVLQAWQGKKENIGPAQQIFIKRACCNGAAQLGKYTQSMESEPVLTKA